MNIRVFKEILSRIIPLLTVLHFLSLPTAAESVVMHIVITPAPTGIVSVEADLQLQNSDIYLQDYGLAENIRWSFDSKVLRYKSQRNDKILLFRGLPIFGKAHLSYRLKCHTTPMTGRMRGLYFIHNSFLAEGGFFPGVVGLEGSLVDIQWKLLPGWRLISGKQGHQRLIDAQQGIWAAGKPSYETEDLVGNAIFRISVLDGTLLMGGSNHVDKIKAFFKYAWENYGPLDKKEYCLLIFPANSIRGYMYHSQWVVIEDQLDLATHEILHWWSNFRVPFWFNEGIHSYINHKMRIRCGLENDFILRLYLQIELEHHQKIVRDRGRIVSLAESSKNFAREGAKSDIYALGVLFANKLDREIQAYNPKTNLDKIFAIVCQNRNREFDLHDLIKKETGYDPKVLFDKYLYGIVEHPEELLK